MLFAFPLPHLPAAFGRDSHQIRIALEQDKEQLSRINQFAEDSTPSRPPL